MSVYAGESFTFTVDGFDFRCTVHQDDSHGAPWEECDGNIGIDRVSRDYKKRPSETFLHKGDRGEYSYAYDVKRAQEIARADRWGCSDETQARFVAKHGREPGPREMAVLAVRDNAEFLRGWCANEWEYVMLEVSMLDADGEDIPGRNDYMGGVESCGDYPREECAPEMAREIIAVFKREKALAFTRRMREGKEAAREARDAGPVGPLPGLGLVPRPGRTD